MRASTRRRFAVTAVLGLVLGTATAVATSAAVHAGTQTVTNACFGNVGPWSDIDWTLNGTGTPNPIELGTGDVTVTGGSIQGAVPADWALAVYNLGFLVFPPVVDRGVNEVPVTLFVARDVSNVEDGLVVQVDQLNFTGSFVIEDSNYEAGTGNLLPEEERPEEHVVTVTPIEIDQPLPDMGPFAPSGGNIEVRQAPPGSVPTIPAGLAASGEVSPLGSIFATVSLPGGLVRDNYDCQPGAALDSNGDGGNDTFTPAESWSAYETIEVTAPPTAPVCQNESQSVGVTQSIQIDLRDNCTDVNEGQGGGSPFLFNVDDSLLAGTLTETGGPGEGLYSYEAPSFDLGTPDTFTFTATDTTGLESNVATASIRVLPNQCDATDGPCELTQIVVQEVEEGVLTFAKEPGVIQMSTVVLDGDAQVSTGALNQVTVTNARGTAAGWSLTAYSTDIGAEGAPTVEPLPGVTIASCTLEGGHAAIGATDPAEVRGRLCIPGNNLAWSPSAAIIHDVVYGDVADVVPGSTIASDADDWRRQLVAAGNTDAGGLGGLHTANSLCGAPENRSGGMFSCDAAMFLGAPASAGEGAYTGALVITLS